MPRPKPQAAHLMASPDDVEAQFYDAMREGDTERLMALWSDDDDAVCIHPGGPRVIGARAIRATFEAMFANGGRILAHPERIRRVQSMDAAVHHLVERIEVATPEGLRNGFVLTTNVYLKTAQGWRILAHHASPGTLDEVPEVTEPPSVLH
jgi:uncharacterized protein (TIGR02246 family)